MEPCILVRLYGGLGNQMFMYAAARALSLETGKPLCIDLSAFYRDRRFRRQPMLHHFAIISAAYRSYPGVFVMGEIFRRLPAAWGKLWLPGFNYILEPRARGLDGLRNSVGRGVDILDGYWQSTEYFSHAAAPIRHELAARVSARERLDISAEGAEGFDKVALHVRCRDVELLADGPYYRRAIQLAQQLHPNSRFLGFSDDIKTARALVGCGAVEFVETEGVDGSMQDVIQFEAMKNCRHHIVSCSTYSWWAAWLAAERGGTVIAPTPRGWWGQAGFLPKEWILVD